MIKLCSIAFKFEGEKMNKLQKICLIFISVTLALASISNIKAQTSTEEMKTFYDSEIAGLHVQVNATAKTQPLGNTTVILNLKRQAETIYVEHFNISIYGYINGTYEIMLNNTTGGNFQLQEYDLNYSVPVPEQVWGVTRGEIKLNFTVTYKVGTGFLTMPYRDVIIGFEMTNIENVYLKSIEEELGNLRDDYNELLQNYTALQNSLGELDTTRRVAAILTVTTVFFVATTLYMILRKPKEYY